MFSINTTSDKVKAQNGIVKTLGPASTASQDTIPVLIVYSPRRPSVFKTRQKYVCVPLPGLSSVIRYR